MSRYEPDGVSGYTRFLSLDTGIHAASFQLEGHIYRRECFLSYPGRVLALRLECAVFTSDRAGTLKLWDGRSYQQAAGEEIIVQ